MQNNFREAMLSTGHLSGSNSEYLEKLYEQFLSDPGSIPLQWIEFFKSLPTNNGSDLPDVSHAEIKKDFQALGKVSR